jgi:SnoaL-like protein
MTDLNSVNKWLQDYVSAWKSYDPDAIRTLFSENVSYRYNPFDEPVRGREELVANWLENRDTPNTYDATYKALAVNGDTAVAQGRTSYYQKDGKTLTRQFDNIFVMQFDSEGRCVDFCEWFMQPRS